AVARQPTFYFKRARRDGFARMFGGGPGLPDGVGRGGAAAPAGGRTSAGFGGGAAVGPAGGRREGGVGSARGAEPTEAEATQSLALKHARADQLERILRQIYGQRGQARLAVDPRTNSLIVAGTEKQLVEVAALVSRLDQPAPEQQIT